MFADHHRSFFRYLPVSPDARAWGAYVVNAGHAIVLPRTPFPPCPHPQDHHMVWQRGRILPTYHFLYITRGEGEFESKVTGSIRLQAGDLVILYPAMWHRYRPVKEVGWHEYWLEFDGTHARAAMNRKEFSSDQPVLHIGQSERFLEVFLRVFSLLRLEPPAYDLILSALVLEAIAEALSALKSKSQKNLSAAQTIRQAKQWLAHQPARAERMEEFAARLNLSYTSFRRLFKAHTGFSPGQFALEVRLRRASELLATTDSAINRIAEDLGFQSVFYFSRVFRQKTGKTPSGFREAARLAGPAGVSAEKDSFDREVSITRDTGLMRSVGQVAAHRARLRDMPGGKTPSHSPDRRYS